MSKKSINLELMPRDKQGYTIPHDHEGLENKDWLIRGVSKVQIPNNRLSKGFFKSSSRSADQYRGLSVDLERLASGRDYLSGSFIGAIKFKVLVPRENGLWVGYDPTENNDAHCQLWRPLDRPQKPLSTPVTKILCAACQWHTEIEGVTIEKY